MQARLAAGALRASQGNRAATALLTGLIHDSRGHRMMPSTAQKKGLHYRYYVSCMLAQGRKAEAGSRPRVAAPDVEALVLKARRGAGLRQPDEAEPQAPWLGDTVMGGVVDADELRIALRAACGGGKAETIAVPWPAPPRRRREIMSASKDAEVRPIRAEARARLVQAIADGRAWLALVSGRARDTRSIALPEGFSNRYPALVRLVEGIEPEMFLIPSAAWLEPTPPFSSRDYSGLKSEPGYGLSLAPKGMPRLQASRFTGQLDLPKPGTPSTLV